MASRPPTSAPVADQPTGAPLGGTRVQTMQRLQVGIALLVGIVLIVGLASVIEERALEADKLAVPEAAATVAPPPTPAANDPLADAGVVPDLPAETGPVAEGEADAPAAAPQP